jgi:hypothetical protein
MAARPLRTRWTAPLLTVAIAGGLGWLLPLPAPELQVEWLEPGSTPTLFSTQDEPCPQLTREEQHLLDEAWDRRDRLDQRILSAKSALAPWIGSTPGFEKLPAVQQPLAIADTVRQHYDPRVTQLHRLDCVEAPCIAALELIGPDQTRMQATARPLQQATRSLVHWQWTGREERAFLTVPLGLPAETDAARHRINLRESLLLTEMSGRP